GNGLPRSGHPRSCVLRAEQVVKPTGAAHPNTALVGINWFAQSAYHSAGQHISGRAGQPKSTGLHQNTVFLCCQLSSSPFRLAETVWDSRSVLKNAFVFHGGGTSRATDLTNA